MGSLKKQEKNTLPCDQGNGPSPVAIFAIHTCYSLSILIIYYLSSIKGFGGAYLGAILD